MIEEEKNPEVHHQTARGARNALTHRQISQESYRAVLRGELSLAHAKSLGRDRGPDTSRGPRRSKDGHGDTRGASAEGTQDAPQPVSRISKTERSRLCMCMCGGRTRGGRFLPGHDVRLVTYAKEYIRGERELTGEQLEYVRESGKLDRAKAQVETEEQRQSEKEARKAARKGNR